MAIEDTMGLVLDAWFLSTKAGFTGDRTWFPRSHDSNNCKTVCVFII